MCIAYLTDIGETSDFELNVSCMVTILLLPIGDVAGIGWERSEGTPPPPGQAPKGRVYFTYCGQRLSPILEDVAGGMWPLVHIQKKVGLYAWTCQVRFKV
jgi:hypothetical protein